MSRAQRRVRHGCGAIQRFSKRYCGLYTTHLSARWAQETCPGAPVWLLLRAALLEAGQTGVQAALEGSHCSQECETGCCGLSRQEGKVPPSARHWETSGAAGLHAPVIAGVHSAQLAFELHALFDWPTNQRSFVLHSQASCREAFQSYIAEDAFFLRSFGGLGERRVLPPRMATEFGVCSANVYALKRCSRLPRCGTLRHEGPPLCWAAARGHFCPSARAADSCRPLWRSPPFGSL